jgi:DNA polymerase I
MISSIEMARPTLFLIDGSSQMYRAYHAFRGKGLSNQEGHTTHAVYVFVTMLRKLIVDHAPAYIAASFDLAGPTFRDQLVDDYKANRAAMPDDLAEQIQLGAPGMRSAWRADSHGSWIRS